MPSNKVTVEWIRDKEYGFQTVTFEQGYLVMEPRIWYCDRGNWIVKVFPNGGSDLARSLDAADMFPRYYFDEGRAKLEIEAWLIKRKLI